MSSKSQAHSKRVIIVGAGIGGILNGITLKQKLGFENFTIYERGDDLGGTWRANTYPGCASDIVTHWYTLSTDLYPYWSQSHILQPELQSYWREIADKYAITNHIICNTKVQSIEWENGRQLYRVVLSDERTGVTRVETADIVISAIGPLDEPRIPQDLFGDVQSFKGRYFHSARWDHSVSLKGKRVAVIGNGSTANQFLPIITEDPSVYVVNFVRTPGWLVPRTAHFQISKFKQWIYAHIPLAMRLYRGYLMFEAEKLYWLAVHAGGEGRLTSVTHKMLERDLTKYRETTAPKMYHDALAPTYPFGCKRLIMDTGYYEALYRSNFDLNVDGIEKIVDTGIVTKKGELIPFDVIIFATGFVTDKYPLEMIGKNGHTYQQYNDEHGGPTGYFGTTVPNFPNFYMMFGPSTSTGHGSVIFSEEVQAGYIAQLVKPVLDGLVTSFEVTSAATDMFNSEIQTRLNTSVWTNCASWYRVGSRGKISALWPGSLLEFWWRLRHVDWSHYAVVGGERWARRRWMQSTVKGVVGMGAVGLGVWATWKWDSEDLRSVRTLVESLLEEVSRQWDSLALPHLIRF